MIWSAFILGLLGSLHCVGMCGPIAFLLPVNRKHSSKKITQIFIYHLGRLLAYALIGLFFGLLGRSLYIFGLQQQLSIVVGVIMIIIVIIPLRVFNKYNFSKPIFRFISKIKSELGNALKRKTPDTFLTIGFLNGLLPCGLVYIAVFASLAMPNIVHGSLYMVFFGLGTIPLMTTAVYLGKFLKTNIKRRIQKAIPVLVILIGVLFILRGLGLGIPYISPTPVVEIATNAIDCN